MAEDIIVKEDIEIVNGGLKVANSDAQHIQHILEAKPGHFTQHPTLGVGVIDNVNGNESKQSIKQRIKVNLEDDNYRINKIDVGGNIDQQITQIDTTRLEP